MNTLQYLNSKLRRFFLIFALLAGAGLAAQDLMVAVLEPLGSREASSLVRNAFSQVIVNARVFQVIDRARTDRILDEHAIQRTSNLISSSEARELGKMLGVDIIFDSEANPFGDSGLEINCQALDIVTGRVLASKSEVIENATPRVISERSRELMQGVISDLNRNLIGGLAGARGGAGGGSSAMLSGLENDLSRMLTSFRGNAKWNQNKANYSLEVDLSNVNLNESRQFGHAVYRVTGNIVIYLFDADGNEASADFEVEEFSEMTSDLMKRKIRNQVQAKISNIVRDLLDALD